VTKATDLASKHPALPDGHRDEEPHGEPLRWLSDSKGDPADELGAEAGMEPLKDFALAITDDLRQPDAAVHGDEKGAATQTHWLGVGSDVRIEEPIPDLQDLDLPAAFLQTQSLENT
jgi:hypothetical protein